LLRRDPSGIDYILRGDRRVASELEALARLMLDGTVSIADIERVLGTKMPEARPVGRPPQD
jgi:hypothetical protein